MPEAHFADASITFHRNGDAPEGRHAIRNRLASAPELLPSA